MTQATNTLKDIRRNFKLNSINKKYQRPAITCFSILKTKSGCFFKLKFDIFCSSSLPLFEAWSTVCF